MTLFKKFQALSLILLVLLSSLVTTAQTYFPNSRPEPLEYGLERTSRLTLDPNILGRLDIGRDIFGLRLFDRPFNWQRLDECSDFLVQPKSSYSLPTPLTRGRHRR
jgi:hypothetical protein